MDQRSRQTHLLNTLLNQLAQEAQSLVLIFRATLAGVPDPTANPMRPPRTLTAQWDSFMLIYASLGTALGVQKDSASLGPIIDKLETITKDVEDGRGDRRQQEKDFSSNVLAFLAGVKATVQTRLEELGVPVYGKSGDAFKRQWEEFWGGLTEKLASSPSTHRERSRRYPET
ncbi:hypothetical protein HK104_005745 [Borealophlyctis nickersoniae]|nr:hypothetical protein HK104_005745 [Borealophlyctis nickersoniae]